MQRNVSLVNHLVRTSGKIGRSVSWSLYIWNVRGKRYWNMATCKIRSL